MEPFPFRLRHKLVQLEELKDYLPFILIFVVAFVGALGSTLDSRRHKGLLVVILRMG